jgi:hypothetical protein
MFSRIKKAIKKKMVCTHKKVIYVGRGSGHYDQAYDECLKCGEKFYK